MEFDIEALRAVTKLLALDPLRPIASTRSNAARGRIVHPVPELQPVETKRLEAQLRERVETRGRVPLRPMTLDRPVRHPGSAMAVVDGRSRDVADDDTSHLYGKVEARAFLDRTAPRADEIYGGVQINQSGRPLRGHLSAGVGVEERAGIGGCPWSKDHPSPSLERLHSSHRIQERPTPFAHSQQDQATAPATRETLTTSPGSTDSANCSRLTVSETARCRRTCPCARHRPTATTAGAPRAGTHRPLLPARSLRSTARRITGGA